MRSEGHSSRSVCLSVCLSVYDYSRTTGYEAAYERYQELMKEGASNCVERHLNLNDCDTSLFSLA